VSEGTAEPDSKGDPAPEQQFGIRRGCEKIAAHGEEDADMAAMHFLNRLGCTATYFPEANVLVPINSVAKRSNTPTSKFVIISIAPSQNAEVALRKR
jgi:hypothetical protein